MPDPSNPIHGVPLTEEQVRQQYESREAPGVPWWMLPAAGAAYSGPPNRGFIQHPIWENVESIDGIPTGGRPLGALDIENDADRLLRNMGKNTLDPPDRWGFGPHPAELTPDEKAAEFLRRQRRHGSIVKYKDGTIGVGHSIDEQDELIEKSRKYDAEVEEKQARKSTEKAQKKLESDRKKIRAGKAIKKAKHGKVIPPEIVKNYNSLTKEGKDKWWKKFGKYIGKGGKWIGPAAALAGAAGGAYAVATNWDNPEFQRALAMKPGWEKAKVWAKGISEHTLGDIWSEDAGDAWAAALDPWYRGRQEQNALESMEAEQSLLYPDEGVRGGGNNYKLIPPPGARHGGG